MACVHARMSETVTTDDGVEMLTWRAVRTQNLLKLRSKTRQVVLYSAILCALNADVLQMVWPGKHGYPEPGEDAYGIAYTVGAFISWIYICIAAVVYRCFFEWWVSTSDSESGTTEKTTDVLNRVSNVMYTALIGIFLCEHVYHTIRTLIFVDAQPTANRNALPPNTKKNWLVRLLLVTGIAWAVAAGYGCMQILEDFDLARVKPVEYWTILLPIQINIGIWLASLIQFVAEKRANAKAQKTVAKDIEVAKLDEKVNLLE